MKVIKPINNNVVSCLDESGREVIATGRGLGFKAKPGTVLEEARVEKVFRMETQTDTERLKDLYASLPPEQMELCTRIIAYAKEVLPTHLSQSVYLTLTDHICFALSRVQQGIKFQNGLLAEARVFYPQEFAVGRYALELIEKELHVRLPQDEAASIALHLVNAEYDTSIGQMVRITQMMQEMLTVINGWEGLCSVQDTLYYDELAVHLKFFVLRVFSGDERRQEESVFAQTIRQVYPREYACAQEVARQVARQSGKQVSDDKTAYLAVNIHRVQQKE